MSSSRTRVTTSGLRPPKQRNYSASKVTSVLNNTWPGLRFGRDLDVVLGNTCMFDVKHHTVYNTSKVVFKSNILNSFSKEYRDFFTCLVRYSSVLSDTSQILHLGARSNRLYGARNPRKDYVYNNYKRPLSVSMQRQLEVDSQMSKLDSDLPYKYRCSWLAEHMLFNSETGEHECEPCHAFYTIHDIGDSGFKKRLQRWRHRRVKPMMQSCRRCPYHEVDPFCATHNDPNTHLYREVRKANAIDNIADIGTYAQEHGRSERIEPTSAEGAGITAFIEQQMGSIVQKVMKVPTNIASGVAATVVALCASIYMFVKSKEVNPAVKSIPIIANVVALFNWFTIWLTTIRVNVNVRIDNVAQMMNIGLDLVGNEFNVGTDFLNSFREPRTANALVNPDWVNIFSHVFGLSAIGYMNLGLGWDFKTIKNNLALRREELTLVHDLRDMVRSLAVSMGFSELVTDTGHSALYGRLLEQLLEHQTYHAVDYIANPCKRTQMEDLIRQCTAMLSTINPENKELGCIRNTCAKSLLELNKMRQTLADLTSCTQRQATIAFTLYGKPGIGKSQCATYILNKVLRICNYRPDIYNVDMGNRGEFYQRYLGQEGAIYNEFCSEQPPYGVTFIQSANKIISGDACNLEGASLQDKHQPCNIKLIGLTANTGHFVFPSVLHAQNNIALLSRLNTFEVSDDLFQEASGRDDQPHRQPDFSHLKFTKIIYDTSRPMPTEVIQGAKRTNVTIDDVVVELATKVLKNQLAYLKLVLSVDTLSVNDTAQLQALVSTTTQKLEDIATRRANSRTSVIGERLGVTIIGMHGMPGLGKTTFAKKLATKIARQRRLMLVVNPGLEQNFEVATVVLLDDPLLHSEAGKYATFIDRLPINSCVICTTNLNITFNRLSVLRCDHIVRYLTSLEFKDFIHPLRTLLKFFRSKKGYYQINDVPQESNLRAFPGIFRRLGIHTDVRISSLSRMKSLVPFLCSDVSLVRASHVDRDLTFLFDADGICHLQGESYSRTQIEDLVMQHVSNAAERAMFDNVTALPPPVHFDVDLHIKQKDNFIRLASSYVELIKLISNGYPNVCVCDIDDEYRKSFYEKTHLSTFRIPKVPQGSNVADIIESITYAMRKCDPSCKLRIRINPDEEFHIIDSVCYDIGKLGDNPTVGAPLITTRSGLLYYNNSPIFVQTYCRLKRGGMYARHVPMFSLLSDAEIHDILVQCDILIAANPQVYIHYRMALQTLALADKKNDTMYEQIVGHQYFPLACKIFAVVMALLTAYVGFTKFLAWYRRDKNVSQASEFSSSKNERIGETMKKYLQTGASEPWEQYAVRQGYTPKELVDYDHWRHADSATTTSTELCVELNRLVAEGKDSAAKIIFDEILAKSEMSFNLAKQMIMPSVKANAVSVAHEIQRNTSIIGDYARKLRKNLCKVEGEKGACYGIVLKDRTVVTVSHIFPTIDSTAVVTFTFDNDSTKTFPFKVKSLNRDKDIAIGIIADPTFPPCKDISKQLIDSVQYIDWSGSCYYVRPFTQIEVYAGNARFVQREYAAYDPNNPYFFPKTAFTFYAVQCYDQAKHVFADGDCGLPLLTVVNNEVKIVGVHNSYSITGAAWFSPLSAQEFEMCAQREQISQSAVVTKPDTIVTATPIELGGKGFVNVPDYADILDNSQELTRYPVLLNKEPFINHVRWCQKLQGHSKYKHSKVCHWRANLQTKQSAGFSCVSPRYIPKSAHDLMFKDSNGNMEPMLSQILKFVPQYDLSIDEDILAKAEGLRQHIAETLYDRDSLKEIRLFDAINGIPGSTNKPIDLTSGVGPYLQKRYGLVDKKPLFNIYHQDKGKDRIFLNNTPAAKEVVRDYEIITAAWNSGTPIHVYVSDCKKVEILPIEKVQIGSVRMFNMLDLAVNLALRSQFAAFVDQCVRNSTCSHTVYNANPYRLYPELMKAKPKQWRSICSDVKRIDKNMNARLIKSIITYIGWLYTGKENHSKYIAISDSLSHCTHIFQGALYDTINGNPSGCYLTVVLNTEARYLIGLYMLIAHWETLPRKFSSYGFDIQMHARFIITGDDEILWYDPWVFDITEDMILKAYKDFGLEVVIDKNSDAIAPNFCSRFMLYDNLRGCYFPALKKSSIEKMLHFSLPHKNFIIDNAVMAVFEATFWNEEYYNIVKSDAIKIMRHNNIDVNTVFLCPYQAQRDHFATYLRGMTSSPIMTEIGTEVLNRMHNLKEDLNIPMENENYIGKYNILHMRDPERFPMPNISYTKQTSGDWVAKTTLPTSTFSCSGSTKQNAKQLVFKELLLSSDLAAVTSNAILQLEGRHRHCLTYTVSEVGTDNVGTVLIHTDGQPIARFKDTDIAGFSTRFRNWFMSPTWLASLTDNSNTIMQLVNYPHDEVRASIELAEQRQANSQVGTQVKPNMAGGAAVPGGVPDGSSLAPQPTSTTGQMGPPAQILNATGGANEVVVLNPQGPANLMSQGGVTFDLKALIYDQFIDKDIEITVSDSIAIGTKLFEIPYDPNGEYMNDYIRDYMQYHSRFNGDIIVRVQVIGNPMFTGALCVGWSPEQLSGSVVSASQYQKYAYKVFSMQQSSVQEFILKDARQYQYYRDVDTFRKGAEYSKVPYLTGICHVTIQNALKEGALVRIRIGSRLASQADLRLGKPVTPFCFSNPIPVPISSGPADVSLNGRSLRMLFPDMTTHDYICFTDGAQYLPNYSVTNMAGKVVELTLKAMMPALVGGVFPDNVDRRMVATSFDTNWITSDRIRTCIIISQFNPLIEAAIAQSTDFIDCCKDKDTWLNKCSDANFISLQGVTIYVKRNIQASLSIYEKDGFLLSLEQQTHVLTDHGEAYIWCYQANPSTNNLKYAAVSGIRNTASPSKIVLPHSSALGAITVNQGTISLPVNWKNLVINSGLPSAVNSQQEVAPSALTTEHIRNVFSDITVDYSSDECAEFELVDPVSRDIIMTIRYLPVPRIFVIKPMGPENYQSYPGDITQLVINRFTQTSNSAVFIQSDTSNWPSRAGQSVSGLSNRAISYFDDILAKRGPFKKRFPFIERRVANAAALAAGEILTSGAASEMAAGSAAHFEYMEGLLNMLKSPATNEAGTMTEGTMRDASTSIMRGPLGYENNPVFNNMTQTENSSRSVATQTTNMSMNSNISSLNGRTPNGGNHVQNILNFGAAAGNSSKMEWGEFSKQLALNCLPILLMQSSQSNGNIVGTGENAIFEHFGITKEDYAYEHSMERQKQQQDWQAMQNQQQRDFTGQQNQLDRAQQEQLAQENFAHQDEMQNKQFAFTGAENEKNRQQQKEMQTSQFAHDETMSQENFEHSSQLQTQKFHEGLITTGLGSAITFATHAMDDATQIYMQGRKEKQESKMMSQSANEHMYVSGASAQSMQLSSHNN